MSVPGPSPDFNGPTSRHSIFSDAASTADYDDLYAVCSPGKRLPRWIGELSMMKQFYKGVGRCFSREIRTGSCT